MIAVKITIRHNDQDIEVEVENRQVMNPSNDKVWEVVNRATAKAIAAKNATHPSGQR